jgi:hypothetical protein
MLWEVERWFQCVFVGAIREEGQQVSKWKEKQKHCAIDTKDLSYKKRPDFAAKRCATGRGPNKRQSARDLRAASA